MKNLNKILTTIAAILVTFGCSDDVLDNSGKSGESQPTQDLTSAQLENGAETNIFIPAGFVNGIYSQMIQTGTGGTDNHDDFGQKGYDIYSDMLCGDMALSVSTYGWYRSEITEFQAPLDFTRSRNRMVWRYYYRLIRSANNVIQSLGGNNQTPTLEDNKFSMGQAKALRAFNYFYLTQFFQKEYDPSQEILPLYLEPITQNTGKSTAQKIYEQMELDLNDAISLLDGFSRTAKNQINQDVARMMLAYVLGAKGGRDMDVANLTQQVIQNGAYTMLNATDVTSGFRDVSSNSWMWGIDITDTNGLGLISWWGQIDAWSYSYAWAGDFKVIDIDLWNAIPNDDARKEQFFSNSSSARYLQPLFKFAASNQIGGISQTITSDYVFMRIEEAYLLNAEANAKSGNEAAAKSSLKELLDRRLPDSSYVDALSAQALLDEIYLQTRIELWGEGKSFLAMKRNKKTTKRGANHLSFAGELIPYNDEKMQFEIPLDEIQNNPLISNQN